MSKPKQILQMLNENSSIKQVKQKAPNNIFNFFTDTLPKYQLYDGQWFVDVTLQEKLKYCELLQTKLQLRTDLYVICICNYHSMLWGLSLPEPTSMDEYKKCGT